MQEDYWLTSENYCDRWPTAVPAFRAELEAAAALLNARETFWDAPTEENEAALVEARIMFTRRHSASDRAALKDEAAWWKRKLERQAEKKRILECAQCLREEGRNPNDAL